ncbi:hypothetical protein, partial [Burkholderia vietnamiensis]|uniref:hypothetical protein n=1 Tax=Burkholderia vietnamiensis TaxID=60552 RepID=UPI003F497CF8
MHAIERDRLSRLRLSDMHREWRAKMPGNVSVVKRRGSGILRIQSTRFTDENQCVCRCIGWPLRSGFMQRIDLHRPSSDLAVR